MLNSHLTVTFTYLLFYEPSPFLSLDQWIPFLPVVFSVLFFVVPALRTFSFPPNPLKQEHPSVVIHALLRSKFQALLQSFHSLVVSLPPNPSKFFPDSNFLNWPLLCTFRKSLIILLIVCILWGSLFPFNLYLDVFPTSLRYSFFTLVEPLSSSVPLLHSPNIPRTAPAWMVAPLPPPLFSPLFSAPLLTGA